MPEKKMSKLQKPATTGIWVVFDKIVDLFAHLTCFALGIIAFWIVVDVMMRYVFNSPFENTTPLGEFIVVCLLAFGGPYLLRDQDFIRVDIVVQKLPAKVRLSMRMVLDFISGLFF